MAKFRNYNPRLLTNARTNRRSMTKAEACLWKYALSKKQMLGFTFKRQRPIENYIVDFVCLEKMLVIEVDGYSHFLAEVSAMDLRKQNRLEALGFRVLRFKDGEVLNEINRVRDLIQQCLK